MTYFGYCVPVFGQNGLKIVHYLLNTQRFFFCCKVLIPCLCKQRTNTEVFYVMRCSFLRNLEQRLSVVKNRARKQLLENGLLQNR